jgi:hypothetical protein
MSVTRLKRKDRKNLARANNNVQVIKQLMRRPTLTRVTSEELKAKFDGAIAVQAQTAALSLATEVTHKETHVEATASGAE